jgi:hypothetical protein
MFYIFTAALNKRLGKQEGVLSYMLIIEQLMKLIWLQYQVINPKLLSLPESPTPQDLRFSLLIICL